MEEGPPGIAMKIFKDGDADSSATESSAKCELRLFLTKTLLRMLILLYVLRTGGTSS